LQLAVDFLTDIDAPEAFDPVDPVALALDLALDPVPIDAQTLYYPTMY
jgi:hypothetical protein